MPDLKYCERCGVLLGYVRSTKKYCSVCRCDVDRERQKRYKAIKEKQNYGIVRCEWCYKPMVKLSKTQKYHKECKPDAYAAKRKERNRSRQAMPGGYGKGPEKKESKVMSVAEMAKVADSMGLSYGELSLKMSQGK